MAKKDSTLINNHKLTPKAMDFQPTAFISAIDNPAPIRNNVTDKPIFEMLNNVVL